MNYHREALEEQDERIKNALSNIDPDTIAKTKEILNSKEYKKLFRKRPKSDKISSMKKFIREHGIEFISLFMALVFDVLQLIFK